MATSEIVILIGSVTAAIVSIINAVAQHWGKKAVVEKLDTAADERANVKKTLESTNKVVTAVHENTNGRLADLLRRIAELEQDKAENDRRAR